MQLNRFNTFNRNIYGMILNLNITFVLMRGNNLISYINHPVYRFMLCIFLQACLCI